MKDFTNQTYKALISALQMQGFEFLSMVDFIKSPYLRSIVLRHDVDKLALNSLEFAKIQSALRIKGTYYFRIVPMSYDENIILEIANLGHEIGYHYETMDTCHGDPVKAWDEFRRNLDTFRKIVPVSTICMHGSPRSKYDNKDLWKNYDYRSVGIIGKPYFDVNFNKVGYLSDTGRCWNGSSVSVRDKVQSNYYLNFKSTFDIINKINLLPDQIMFTFHPQRWTNNFFKWSNEFILQNAKNVTKYFIIKFRNE